MMYEMVYKKQDFTLVVNMVDKFIAYPRCVHYKALK